MTQSEGFIVCLLLMLVCGRVWDVPEWAKTCVCHKQRHWDQDAHDI